MYSDRELLELAAKAAGHVLGPDWDCLQSGIFINGDDSFSGVEWNPLTDDGDALRLAVRLHMSPSWSPSKKSVKASIENDPFLVFGIDATGDDCADIRRIIVMSAAAIGEATQ